MVALPKLKRPVPLGAVEKVTLTNHVRPTNRDQCRGGPRPCPFVGCRYHLYLTQQEWRGKNTVLVNFPGKEPWEIPETCSLDVAERGEVDTREIGKLMNLSKTMILNLIERALLRMYIKLES